MVKSICCSFSEPEFSSEQQAVVTLALGDHTSAFYKHLSLCVPTHAHTHTKEINLFFFKETLYLGQLCSLRLPVVYKYLT